MDTILVVWKHPFHFCVKINLEKKMFSMEQILNRLYQAFFIICSSNIEFSLEHTLRAAEHIHTCYIDILCHSMECRKYTKYELMRW